jgi:hypothetical protein
MRLPPPSPITGPVHVAGVAAGETLDIVLEEVAAASGSASAPLIVTIGAAAHVGHPGRHALQVATSVPGYVRLPALLEGGMLSFGPVLAERDVQGERLWEPVAARVTARCGVTRQHGS